MGTKFEKIKKIIDKDKRLCERLELPLKVYYFIESQGEKSDWIGPVLLDNIGGKGFGFHNSIEIPKGSKLSIKILMENDLEPVFFSGEVVWIKEEICLSSTEDGKDICVYSYGIFMKEKDPKAYQKFVNYISDNILDKYLNKL